MNTRRDAIARAFLPLSPYHLDSDKTYEWADLFAETADAALAEWERDNLPSADEVASQVANVVLDWVNAPGQRIQTLLFGRVRDVVRAALSPHTESDTE